MTMVVTAILFLSAIASLALRANARFQRADRLPMQWWISGEVTWSAPRLVALTAIPALAFGVIVSILLLSSVIRPRPGQEGMAFPMLIGIGSMFLALELLHLWLIERTLRSDGS